MGFTGRLGSADSKPGNVELGIDLSAQSFTDTPNNTLGFSDSGTEVADFVRSVSDTLSFMDTGEGGTDTQMNVHQTLVFSETIDEEHDMPNSDSDTLTFVDSGSFSADYHRTISDTLSLSDAALNGEEFARTGTNTLSFSDAGVGGLDRSVSVSQSISFSDVAENNFKEESVSDTLVFSEDIGVIGPVYIDVGNTLNLTSTLGTAGTSNSQAPGTFVLFQQLAGRVQSVTVTQSISFTDSGIRNNIGLNTLALVQSVSAGKGVDVADTLAFVDTATPAQVLNRTIADTLTFTQSIAYQIIAGCTKLLYSPFIGSTGSGITPPSATPPTLGNSRLTLTYPFVGPTHTVMLRNPEFNNKDRLNFNRINRETRGGTLIVFADPKWPKTQVLSVQVDALKQSQIDDLFDFLGLTLGKEIGLLDWENRLWRGVITTPDATVTQVDKTDRSVTFDFQGALA